MQKRPCFFDALYLLPWRLLIFLMPVLVPICFGLVCSPSIALAQVATVENQFVISPSFTVGFQSPTVANNGVLINCTYGDANCVTFNLAACNRTPDLPIQMTVLNNVASGSYVANIHAYAWLQNNSSNCYFNSNDPNTSSTVVQIGSASSYLTTNSTYFLGTSGSAFNIPGDVGASSLSLVGIMNAFSGVCQANAGIPLTVYTLCFGADLNNDGIVGAAPLTNTAPTVGDPNGFIQFAVDTIPPPAPSNLQTTSLVSRVTVSFDYDQSTNDVYQVQIVSTNDPNNLNQPDCSQWNQNVQIAISTAAGGSGSTNSFSQDIAGTNGEQYGYCAQTIDYVGNVSLPTAVVYDSPHVECDFIGCYPAALNVGYCGATLGPAWLGILTSCFLLAKASYRKKRSSKNSS